MNGVPEESELTDAAREVRGLTDVYPAPAALAEPPETVAAVLARDLDALSKVYVQEEADGVEALAHVGVDRSRPAPETAKAAAEAIAARFDADAPVHVTVRVTRIS
ncbi:hypothetical protein ABC304_06970 [Microbacterium sp. 1P10UB]|uniref:hypothetical protein n=1 Tax=unclassified Microbacterium TaxID=2609290 RepID=UPI0039A13AA9